MSGPTDAEIRQALVDRLQQGDSYADSDEWISYLSDGLGRLWPARRLPNGDLELTMDRELDAMVEGATERIARQCQELAIDELTKVAIAYRDRVQRRADYRARALDPA